ncbi:MAG TPA: hypothetical protein VN957_08830 [Chthoniobacterales bacterium]|jgi:hypothetical protein|nr:hypothetical protein [Chthoniobacterales bacterium]
MPSAQFEKWAIDFRQRLNQMRYKDFIPIGTGFALDEYLEKCYGESRLEGETDDQYRDRCTRPPVTERHEIHDIVGYDA